MLGWGRNLMTQEYCDVPTAAFEGCWSSSFWSIKQFFNCNLDWKHDKETVTSSHAFKLKETTVLLAASLYLAFGMYIQSYDGTSFSQDLHNFQENFESKWQDYICSLLFAGIRQICQCGCYTAWIVALTETLPTVYPSHFCGTQTLAV